MEYKPQNQMAQAISPYLRQHKDNPVHWQPWGQAAFDAAHALNRPVLLSIGYAACHWCHVMAHESFDNPAIARLINNRFIAIKLDREERPDLDSLYQHALALMGQHGGWPLTMFLTPDGVPFWGGTYFPPLPRHGMPGFADVLAGVAESFDHEQDAVAFNAASIKSALTERTALAQAAPMTPEIVTRAAAHFLLEIDSAHGGLGHAPKFPQLTKLRLLFDHGLRSGDARYTDAVVQALVQMCRGGLYDHLGGGFHRYCVDAQWLVPHFEKMLDDQTQFIALLSDVLSHTAHPLLQQALHDSVSFVLRDMRDADSGLFISSFDADSDGGEGTYYQWSYDEIAAELVDHAPLFCAVYNIQRDGNWDDPHHGHGNILNRLSSSDAISAADEEMLRAMRKKLLYKRNHRNPPARDDKILTDINARMIAALASAGKRHQQAEWHSAARDAFQKLVALAVDDDGSVRHVANDPSSACLLDDCAQLALAALALAETDDGDMQAHDLGWAKKLVRHALAAFVHDNGMVQAVATARQDSFTSMPPLYDTPAPAAAGALLRAVTCLGLLEPHSTFSAEADRLAAALAAPARAEFTMMASTLAAVQFYQNPVMIHANAHWSAFLRRYIPDCLIIPAQDNALTVCVGQRCLLPAYDEAAAQHAIKDALRACLHKPANG